MTDVDAPRDGTPPAGGRVACHLVRRTDWEAHDPATPWAPPSLATEGFVHLSWLAQVDATVARHLPDAGPGEVLVVMVALDRLDGEVRVEDTTGRGEAYPHVYGQIDPDAVLAVTTYRRPEDR